MSKDNYLGMVLRPNGAIVDTLHCSSVSKPSLNCQPSITSLHCEGEMKATKG